MLSGGPRFARTPLASLGATLKKGGTREMWNKSLMWNKPLMWNSPKMWNRPKDVEQAQRGGTGPEINHTCFLADLASLGQRSSLRSAPRFAGQLLKKGGTHEMWNKSLMWSSPKMWNWPKD